ncbi:MAG: MEKHLA domain-containing protein [Methyloceanibacter sp.]|uniref:MEKHLA domain-containing protein n=1 Tax=Methyloceanibacter sp. TaxID=1965321 RepID=UPI001D54A476|nr:MEKHLA domain-containing protein [Methyloceanibacter sp.]MCB1442561.1 MEKHLA domain-containing protein [Methyloceanibacter sp.]MCC0059470.1 MEKHLA domain-containing protein [Hyphomicrobiaceae bacterium]
MTIATDTAFFGLLADSYKRLLGHAPPFLNGSAMDRPRWLYEEARACVLAHSPAPDPLFIYANKAAQALFEYRWDEIVGMPSRLSAEVPNRAERQRLLDAVARDGFATGYSGIRIAKSGRRFRIDDGILWQLRDADDTLHGVAATFSHWSFEKMG